MLLTKAQTVGNHNTVPHHALAIPYRMHLMSMSPAAKHMMRLSVATQDAKVLRLIALNGYAKVALKEKRVKEPWSQHQFLRSNDSVLYIVSES
jgi:hypothetical protein